LERLEELVGGSSNVSYFLKEMNRLARQLGMSSSNFANPHGLSNPANYSTAADLAKLCTYAMRNQHFRAIVSTQHHGYHYELPLPC
jgi:serine-type D-Ala-D-Ala carboxypeptidase (penicillin-binding protein 5/6)